MTQAENHALITAKRVTGTPVFDIDGQRIGHIEDLSIDKASGQVVHTLLSFGGFLGIGDRFHPLPWSVLRYDTHKDGYVVSLTRAELEAAASYSTIELDDLGRGAPDWPKLGVI